MNKTELVFEKEKFEGKKIKCLWCVKLVNSVCSVKKIKMKVRKPRRCKTFVPNSDAITREINRGKGIKTARLSREAYLTKKERKEERERRQALLENAIKSSSSHSEHPLTGDLSRFTTTVEDG